MVPGFPVSDPHAVDMPVHQYLQRAVAQPRHHVAQPVEEHFIEAELFILLAHPLAALCFRTAFGRNGNDLPQEGHDILLISPGCLQGALAGLRHQSPPD